MIDRRAFMAGLGAALAAPLAAEAQPETRVYRVEILLFTDRQAVPGAAFLRERLRDLGYREGHNIMFDERVSVGRPERLLESAADLVRRRVDVIVTGLDPETHAAKGATDSIPIVVLAATDPVGNGFVASLARPGGNVTGVTFDAGFDVASKRIELLKAAAPKAKTVGFLFNPEFPGMAGYVQVWKATTASLGLGFQAFEVRDSKEIRAAFAAIKHARPDALFVGSGWPTTVDDRQRVIDFTIESRLPAMFVNLAWMKQGGLMAYLPSDQDRARRVAVLIDKILKGARPGDLSIEQPTKFDLVINLKTAKALGLTIPPSLLLRADQVISDGSTLFHSRCDRTAHRAACRRGAAGGDGAEDRLSARHPERERLGSCRVAPLTSAAMKGEHTMGRCRSVSNISARRIVLPLAMVVLALGMAQDVTGQPRPAGEAVMAWAITIAPTWFDPSTAPPQITPFGILYALHDALVRPLPGQKMGNSLAESWMESADGLTYEFKLRRGLKFHNGDVVTAEDVKFSFERYKGAGAKELNLRVRQVEIIDPLTVRFVLKEPWPDFMTFYGTTATAAGIVVPKKYVIRVGDDGFRKHPIGAGPYKFVSHTPGVEVVLEADPGYWRRVPSVKRLVMKSVPEGTTRVAMLKKGEADLAFLLEGPDAETVTRDARLSLVATRHASAMWIEFAEQWDAKSPWHDRRVRLAVNHALDRRAISETACLGYCPSLGIIVPPVMDYALKVEPPQYDPQKAKQLLAEAGYPQGFDAGDFTPLPGFSIAGEAAVNYLNAVGIRVKMRAMERAAFYAAWQEKKLRGLFLTAAGNSGNAATRVEAFIYSKGSYAYGGYPDIDELFLQQARERDPAKREVLLHRIQQLTLDRVMFAPIWSTRVLIGVGPRVADHTINLIPMSIWPSYEDMKLKNP